MSSDGSSSSGGRAHSARKHGDVCEVWQLRRLLQQRHAAAPRAPALQREQCNYISHRRIARVKQFRYAKHLLHLLLVGHVHNDASGDSSAVRHGSGAAARLHHVTQRVPARHAEAAGSKQKSIEIIGD